MARTAYTIAQQRAPGVVTRAPTLIAVLLGLAIVAEALHIAITLLRPPMEAPVNAPPIRRPGAGHPRLLEANIIAAHLFGAQQLAREQPQAERIATSLVLTGIVAMNDARGGLAMLGTDSAHARLVPAGAEAAIGTTLSNVYPDHVILQRGSERLVLRLPRDQLTQSSNRFGSAFPPGADDPAKDDEQEETAEGKPRLTDAAALYGLLHLRAASVGDARGERIMNVVDNVKPLATLGLAPGDVILEVNGAPFDSPYADLAKTLQDGATLLVARNGQQMSVAINPSMATAAAGLARRSVAR